MTSYNKSNVTTVPTSTSGVSRKIDCIVQDCIDQMPTVLHRGKKKRWMSKGDEAQVERLDERTQMMLEIMDDYEQQK
jgi:hypothetical protein